jgi:flagellar biogenesis protein FliO
MRALFIVCALTTAASAEPRFEVLDRENAVEVIAYDVKATSTKISPIRTRLEVPIAPTASIPKLQPAGEKTIKVVERDHNMLSVKLAFEHPEVVELAKAAQAIQVGDDLHIIVPRDVPVAAKPNTLPPPTLPPKLAEQAAASAPVPVVTTPRPQPVVAPEPVAPAPVTPAKTDVKQKPAVARPAEGSSRTNTLVLGALALVALGCGTWLTRRNRNAAQATSKIDVIAQRALGAKAKIVWLRAGERELLVTVAAQSVQVVTHWPTGESPPARAALPTAFAQAAPEQGPASPAVAGILKLRARTNAEQNDTVVQPALSGIRKLRALTQDDANAVADAEWAKEILAATASARR